MVGQQARRRAELARERLRVAQRARDGLASASEEAETLAAGRVAELAGVAGSAEEQLAVIRRLGAEAELAASRAQAAAADAALLAGVRAPDEVPGLASRISAADGLVAERTTQRDRMEEAEADGQQARDALPDKAIVTKLCQAHEDRRRLESATSARERQLASCQADEEIRRGELEAAELKLKAAPHELPPP